MTPRRQISVTWVYGGWSTEKGTRSEGRRDLVKSAAPGALD